MPKPKIKVAKSKPKKFKLLLVCGDKKYTAKTDTIEEALDIIYKDSFGMIKTWGVFNLETGGKKAEIRMRPLPIKRLFNMKFARTLFEKRILISLK